MEQGPQGGVETTRRGGRIHGLPPRRGSGGGRGDHGAALLGQYGIRTWCAGPVRLGRASARLQLGWQPGGHRAPGPGIAYRRRRQWPRRGRHRAARLGDRGEYGINKASDSRYEVTRSHRRPPSTVRHHPARGTGVPGRQQVAIAGGGCRARLASPCAERRRYRACGGGSRSRRRALGAPGTVRSRIDRRVDRGTDCRLRHRFRTWAGRRHGVRQPRRRQRPGAARPRSGTARRHPLGGSLPAIGAEAHRIRPADPSRTDPLPGVARTARRRRCTLQVAQGRTVPHRRASLDVVAVVVGQVRRCMAAGVRQAGRGRGHGAGLETPVRLAGRQPRLALPGTRQRRVSGSDQRVPAPARRLQKPVRTGGAGCRPFTPVRRVVARRSVRRRGRGRRPRLARAARETRCGARLSSHPCRPRYRRNCAPIKWTATVGWPVSAAGVRAPVSPTTWASARPCKRWPCCSNAPRRDRPWWSRRPRSWPTGSTKPDVSRPR